MLFGDDETSGTLLLELARLKINENETIKEFNQIFITLLNKIPDKPPKAIQVEYYTATLPLIVAMFVKRKEIRTLEENFKEAIKIEKDLASISTHRDNDESEASTSEKQGKKNREVKSDGKDVVIMQLQSEITSLKRSKREGNKPTKEKNTSHQTPPTSRINLEDYAMDNFFHAHYANHSEKNCPEFMNLFKAMILPWECQEEEEEEEEEPPSNLHLIWDDTELDYIDDDIMEEACVGNDYNLWSKDAPQINDFPSTSKSESLGNIKDMRRNSTTSQSTTNMDLTQMILGDLQLDYSVVEDLKKMNANTTMFELCKITQLMK
jgi:hypothetical protein